MASDVAHATGTSPHEGPRLQRTLADLRALARADVTFGGPVTPGARGHHHLDITGLHSTMTRSLQGLRVQTRHGLGGQALALGRPVSVINYHDARGITHHYDAPVRAERLQTVTALPVVVDRVPRMVLYLAHRAEVALGEIWYDALMPMVRRLEHDIAVDDEVRRRLAGLRDALPRAGRPTIGRTELGALADELGELTALVQDPQVRARLIQVQDRLADGARPPAAQPPPPASSLAPREVDVLDQVAQGRSNRETAEALGLVESTVKGYLKTAMRKLGATNRVHAVRLAREAGLVD